MYKLGKNKIEYLLNFKSLLKICLLAENNHLIRKKFHYKLIILKNYLVENKKDLIFFIIRHRLVSFFATNIIFQEYFPDIFLDLKNNIQNETFRALKLTSLTCNVSEILKKEKINAIFFKGIPLSLQTTGKIYSRGKGDLDILINPKDLEKAIKILENNDFILVKNKFPKNYNSFWGRYSKLVSNQLSLYKKDSNNIYWIDLHWSLSIIKGILPKFNYLWESRIALNINGYQIYTLNKEIAYLHLCLHSSNDRWKYLRSYVDLFKLSQKLNNKMIQNLNKYSLIKSCSYNVLKDFENNNLRLLSKNNNFNFNQKDINEIQTLPVKYFGYKVFDLKIKFDNLFYIFNLSKKPISFIPNLLKEIIPPESIVDINGENKNIIRIIFERYQKLIKLYF